MAPAGHRHPRSQGSIMLQDVELIVLNWTRSIESRVDTAIIFPRKIESKVDTAIIFSRKIRGINAHAPFASTTALGSSTLTENPIICSGRFLVDSVDKRSFLENNPKSASYDRVRKIQIKTVKFSRETVKRESVQKNRHYLDIANIINK